MTFRTPLSLLVVVVGMLTLLGPLGAVQQRPTQAASPLRDYDVREDRAAATPSPGAAAELQRQQPSPGRRAARLHAHTGGLRVLDALDVSVRVPPTPRRSGASWRR